HHGGVKDVNAAVCAVVEPQFFFVGSKSDAVAGAAMPLGGTFLKARYFDAVQHFSCFVVSHFKTKQIVDVDETKGLAAIDGERANGIAERSDLFDQRARFGVHHGKKGRLQACEIDAGTVRAINGVMRAGTESDFCDDIASEGIHYVPVWPFEGWNVEQFAVRGDGEAIGAYFIFFFPDLFFGDEIETSDALESADVEFAGFRAGGDAFYILGGLAGREVPSGNAFDQLVGGIHVVDQNAYSTILQFVANAGNGNIETMRIVLLGRH